VPALEEVKAVSFDFFNTLVFHREGRGRGRALVAYLERQGFETASWDHQALYDIFERHALDYDPHLPPEERTAYQAELAVRTFERLGVRASPHAALDHAAELWRILGPEAFAVFSPCPGVRPHLRVRRCGSREAGSADL